MWGEKYFALGDTELDQGELCVTFGMRASLLLHKKFNRYIMVGWSSVHTSVYGCETIQRKSAGKMKGADEDELPFLRHSSKGRFIYDQPYELSYETPCVRFSFTEKAKVLLLGFCHPSA